MALINKGSSCGPGCGCEQSKSHRSRLAVWGFVLSLLALGALSSCAYSLTGASVQEDVSTFSVELFENRALLVSNLLAPTLTDQVRQKFQQQSRLQLVRREGDLRVSGVITNYFVAPVALQSTATAGANRLTITVKVTFVNVKHPEENFEQDFTQFQDFPATQTLAQRETDLNRLISDRLSQDIFNKALSGW